MSGKGLFQRMQLALQLVTGVHDPLLKGSAQECFGHLVQFRIGFTGSRILHDSILFKGIHPQEGVVLTTVPLRRKTIPGNGLARQVLYHVRLESIFGKCSHIQALDRCDGNTRRVAQSIQQVGIRQRGIETHQ